MPPYLAGLQQGRPSGMVASLDLKVDVQVEKCSAPRPLKEISMDSW